MKTWEKVLNKVPHRTVQKKKSVVKIINDQNRHTMVMVQVANLLVDIRDIILSKASAHDVDANMSTSSLEAMNSGDVFLEVLYPELEVRFGDKKIAFFPTPCDRKEDECLGSGYYIKVVGDNTRGAVIPLQDGRLDDNGLFAILQDARNVKTGRLPDDLDEPVHNR